MNEIIKWLNLFELQFKKKLMKCYKIRIKIFNQILQPRIIDKNKYLKHLFKIKLHKIRLQKKKYNHLYIVLKKILYLNHL